MPVSGNAEDWQRAPSAWASVALSPEQRAVLGIHGGEAGIAAAALVVSVEIREAVDRARLEAALRTVVVRHAALGATIRPVVGYTGLRQSWPEDAPALHWQEADFERRPESPELAALLRGSGHPPFDLERGEVLRAACVRLGAAHYLLVLSASALAVDRGSLQTLLAEIAAAYRGGERIGDCPFQYSQFVEWRAELANSEEARQGREYWQRTLGTAVSRPHLPRWRTPREGSSRVALRRSLVLGSLGGSDAERLLHAAFALFIARISGSSRFVLGWQHDCRRDYEVMQGSVGVFDKVLPVVVEVDALEPFSSWASRWKEKSRELCEVQEYWPVDEPPTVEHLAIGIASHALPRAGKEFGATELRDLPGPLPCFGLALDVAVTGNRAELALHVDASLFDMAAAERWLGQFAILVSAALDAPETPVARLPLLGASEREALLAEAPRVDFGSPSIGDRVAFWAVTTPEAPAVQEGGDCVNYQELLCRADALAVSLRSRGVTPGSLVALNLPRSTDLVVAILAVFRAGAGYLPLEPEWPQARRDALLEDAKPALVLHTVSLELSNEASAKRMPEASSTAERLAYVIYTSGSTGRPKGVAVEQRQLQNYVAAASEAMGLASARRWALTSTVAADLGNTALFGALFNGACLVIASNEELRDAESFARFVARRAIDAIKIVPSHLEALLENEDQPLPRWIVLGGEAAPRALVERIARMSPKTVIYNHYGPTETTVGVLVHRVDTSAEIPDSLPLTRTLANNRVLVLDGARELVPVGGLGEVYIGGAQLSRGYLNHDGREAFVDDPFRPGERLYRTGDLAYVLPDGALLLAGRADHQLKIRGFRVEPAELEAALLAEPGVRQAIALAETGAAVVTGLVAVLVVDAENRTEAGRRRLQQRLAGRLPSHLLPQRYLFLAELPRLPNGKVDRVALSALVKAGSRRVETRARTALEALLATSVAELLERDEIDVEHDFFEIGVHSLIVIRLVARIKRTLELTITPGQVFDNPSVARLAAALGSLSGDPDGLERLARSQRA